MGGRKKQIKRILKVAPESMHTGTFAVALCGRETGGVYIVVGGSEVRGCVFIADGKHRRLATPKLKKLCHLRLCGRSEEASALIAAGQYTDGDIRRAIKSMKAECSNEGLKGDK